MSAGGNRMEMSLMAFCVSVDLLGPIAWYIPTTICGGFVITGKILGCGREIKIFWSSCISTSRFWS